MNRWISGALGALLAASGATLAQSDEARVATDEARADAAMKDLGQRLKGALVAKMQAEGPVAAVGFCHQEAPKIAASVGTEHGVTVGRTAIRHRGPDNAPTAWQQEVLAGFVERARQAPAASLSWVSQENGVYREARGIATEKPCLACHGETIAAPVRAAIAANYPDDRATGFAEGDLRGMFWVEIDRASDAGRKTP